MFPDSAQVETPECQQREEQPGAHPPEPAVGESVAEGVSDGAVSLPRNHGEEDEADPREEDEEEEGCSAGLQAVQCQEGGGSGGVSECQDQHEQVSLELILVLEH